MFHFAKFRRVDPVGKTGDHRRRSRPPITIGFEQLEGRELLSTGVAWTIDPIKSRPPVQMPRPYVGSINPEVRVEVSVPIRGRTDRTDQSRPVIQPTRFRGLGGRFRMG